MHLDTLLILPRRRATATSGAVLPVENPNSLGCSSMPTLRHIWNDFGDMAAQWISSPAFLIMDMPQYSDIQKLFFKHVSHGMQLFQDFTHISSDALLGIGIDRRVRPNRFLVESLAGRRIP